MCVKGEKHKLSAGIPIKCNLKLKKTLFKESIQTVSHITLWLLLLQHHIVSPAPLKLGGKNENGHMEDVCMIVCNLIEYSSYRKNQLMELEVWVPGSKSRSRPATSCSVCGLCGRLLLKQIKLTVTTSRYQMHFDTDWVQLLQFVVVLQVVNYITGPTKVRILQP